jgi:hypothetical protein
VSKVSGARGKGKVVVPSVGFTLSSGIAVSRSRFHFAHWWREVTLGIENPEGSNSPLRLSGAKPTDEQRGHKLKTGETPNGHDEQETSVALVLRPPLPGDKRESTERNQKYGTVLHNLTYLVVSAGRANFPVFLQFSNFSLHC